MTPAHRFVLSSAAIFLCWIGPVAGFELDLADAPTFLDRKPDLAIDNRNHFTLIGNAVVQFPTASRRIRPYAVGGIGVVHTKITMPDDTVLVETRTLASALVVV